MTDHPITEARSPKIRKIGAPHREPDHHFLDEIALPAREPLDVLPLLEAWQTHIACDHDDGYSEGCLPVEACLKGIVARLPSKEHPDD